MVLRSEWKRAKNREEFCAAFPITVGEYTAAHDEKRLGYIERDIRDKKTGKTRSLCYPNPEGVLRKIQDIILNDILRHLDISPNIQGYRKGSHNILVADKLCLFKFVGTLDITRFHPSITEGHVCVALKRHGLSWRCAREISSLVTYRGKVPQGASTSSILANIVLDQTFRRSILPYSNKLKVAVVNYGDDIAFMANDQQAVRSCVRFAKRALKKAGFESNDKGRECEHRGGYRRFLGTATGRETVDFPREKYREFRKELRAALEREKSSPWDCEVIGPSQLKSWAHKIGYIRRLSSKKAKQLRKILRDIKAVHRQKKNEQTLAKNALELANSA